MKRYTSFFASAAVAAAFLVPALASAATWDTTGTYTINVNYLSVNYLETLILTQSGTAITGVSLDTIPSASFFNVIGGSVIGSAVAIKAQQGSLVVDLTGTIASNGTLSGTWADEAPGTRTGTWTTVSGAATPVVPVCSGAIGSPLVNVTQVISNDVDSGFHGNWALDDYSRHIQVWLDGSTYCAQVDYNGAFHAPAGVLSPAAGVPITANIDGTMVGGYRASIVGTMVGSPSIPTTVDYLGNVSTGNTPGYVSWLNATFNSGYSFDYLDNGNDWSWTYTTAGNPAQSWTNAGSGSSGDIINTVGVTTVAATALTSTGATVNGINTGDTTADNTSFWWGTTPLVGTLTPGSNDTEFPLQTNWYHDGGLGPVPAGASFNESLTSLTPGTQYYFVAWVEVGGIWYPGAVLSFTTPVPAPTTGTISGMKYNDLNRNGKQDAGELGLSGWVIRLIQDTVTSTGEVDTLITTATTDASGNYTFANVAPGTYDVRETHQKGWKRMSKNPKDIVIAAGDAITGVNFGNATVKKGDKEDTDQDDNRDDQQGKYYGNHGHSDYSKEQDNKSHQQSDNNEHGANNNQNH